MLTLIGKETYERVYTENGNKNEQSPTFYLKKLSLGEMSSINDNIYSMTETKTLYLGGTLMRLKIKYGLVDWKNVVDKDNNSVVCTDENKEKLPANVTIWLVKEIDELNGIGIKVSEEERKNFLSL